jgi:hypothetical protein
LNIIAAKSEAAYLFFVHNKKASKQASKQTKKPVSQPARKQTLNKIRYIKRICCKHFYNTACITFK